MATDFPPLPRFAFYRLDRQDSKRYTIIEDVLQIEHQQRQEPKYDDLYDMSDDETDGISIALSPAPPDGDASPALPKRYPSLIIPSPSAWPTHQVHGKEALSVHLLLPHARSPAKMGTPSARMVSHVPTRSVGSTTTVPSLDGSLTSEELSSLSCPSTPDCEQRKQESLTESWTSPIQLDPQSLKTLRCLTGAHGGEPSIMIVAEMKEVGEQKPELGVDVANTSIEADDQAELSALSFPSPGGFFSSLEPITRRTWSLSPVDIPSTTTAERFYGVPWAPEPSDQAIEYGYDGDTTEGPPTARKLTMTSPRSAGTLTDGPPTARRLPLTPKSVSLIRDGPSTARRLALASPRSASAAQQACSPKDGSTGACSLKDKRVIEEDFQGQSQCSLDRTDLWLQEQETYLKEVTKAMHIPAGSGFRNFKQLHISPIAEEDEPVQEPWPSPQSMSCADAVSQKDEQAKERPSEESMIFIAATRELIETRQPNDAFVQRKVRTDKLRLDRKCLFSTHLQRLDCNFDIPSEETQNRRPQSDMFGPASCDESKELDAKLKQRRALDALRPVSWNLEATKLLNGGSLLTSPTGKLMPKLPSGAVLDLGGISSCDWAWEVALTHPRATVTTVYTESDQRGPPLPGPSNHKLRTVPNLWTLPFAVASFHVVSARNSMALLRTDRPSSRPGAPDEYDLCLRECMRLLKPGGYLEFSLLDAEIMCAAPLTTAASVEFAFNLRVRGYDATPTKVWLPRLRRAGFAQVKRAWIHLPLAMGEDATGTTADASHVSGMVGAWAWERWLVKLRAEMGWGNERLLDGVGHVLEEGSREGACWRYLSGWARKDM